MPTLTSPASSPAVVAAPPATSIRPCPATVREIAGDRVYLHPEDFVRRSFENDPPPATALWIAPELREELSREFGWRPGLRVRYWRQNARTVWVLDEVG